MPLSISSVIVHAQVYKLSQQLTVPAKQMKRTVGLMGVDEESAHMAVMPRWQAERYKEDLKAGGSELTTSAGLKRSFGASAADNETHQSTADTLPVRACYCYNWGTSCTCLQHLELQFLRCLQGAHACQVYPHDFFANHCPAEKFPKLFAEQNHGHQALETESNVEVMNACNAFMEAAGLDDDDLLGDLLPKGTTGVKIDNNTQEVAATAAGEIATSTAGLESTTGTDAAPDAATLETVCSPYPPSS